MKGSILYGPRHFHDAKSRPIRPPTTGIIEKNYTLYNPNVNACVRMVVNRTNNQINRR